MKFFTIEELCKSETATAKGIKNTPTEEHKKHLEELVENILDPLREEWGSAIHINSGYRGDKLNKVVGGSATSSHCLGYAVDLSPVNGKMTEFKAFVKKWLADKKFDQYINEFKGKSEWVHIGLKNSKGLQRKQYLLYKNGVYSNLK